MGPRQSNARARGRATNLALSKGPARRRQDDHSADRITRRDHQSGLHRDVGDFRGGDGLLAANLPEGRDYTASGEYWRRCTATLLNRDPTEFFGDGDPLAEGPEFRNLTRKNCGAVTITQTVIAELP